jgi:hypothetical protein
MRTAIVKVDVRQASRSYVIRMQGAFDADSMRRCCDDIRRATDAFHGKPHFCIADMRGMSPLREELGQMLGATIAYSRAHGVALCAHLSDDTIQRLQLARLVRLNAPHDEGTIDVVSLDEAERVVKEAHEALLQKADARAPA